MPKRTRPAHVPPAQKPKNAKPSVVRRSTDGRTLSPANIETLAMMKATGHTNIQIAESLGCNRNTVTNQLNYERVRKLVDGYRDKVTDVRVRHIYELTELVPLANSAVQTALRSKDERVALKAAEIVWDRIGLNQGFQKEADNHQLNAQQNNTTVEIGKVFVNLKDQLADVLEAAFSADPEKHTYSDEDALPQALLERERQATARSSAKETSEIIETTFEASEEPTE